MRMSTRLLGKARKLYSANSSTMSGVSSTVNVTSWTFCALHTSLTVLHAN